MSSTHGIGKLLFNLIIMLVSKIIVELKKEPA